MKGKVKWYEPSMGYGFIVNEEGENIFVTKTDIINSFEPLLKDGEEVEFNEVKEPLGLQARNVVKILL